MNRRQPDLTVLAEDVHKSHNISAILRTCDAVGIYRVHAVSSGGELRRHHMMAGGSRRWVDVAVHPDLQGAIHSLRADGWRLLAAHPGEGARDYREIDYTEKVAIVLGSELDGLTVAAVDASDERIAVPMEGMVASLNVSVAAALILYEAQRQRRAAGLYARLRIGEEDYCATLFEWAYPDIAERCRVRGRAYPDLAEDGSLKSNPLDDVDETTTVDS